MLPKSKPPLREIDEEDVELLKKLASGESINAIAYRNGYTVNQIRYRVEGIKQALKATTIPEVIATAFRKGILH